MDFSMSVQDEPSFNALPGLVRYALACSGARTAKGGVVEGSSGCRTMDIRMARVGDVVRYPDGSSAEVTSGAGFAATEDRLPFAIVGSHVSGGDHMVSTPIVGSELHIDEDARPEGFLVEGYRYRA